MVHDYFFQKIKQINNLSFDFFCITKRDYNRFLIVNNKFCEVMGYSENELTQNDYSNFIFPEDLEETIDASKKIIDLEEKNISMYNRYVSKDYKTITIKWNMSEIDGYLYNFGKIEEDIENLNILGYELKKLIENSSVGICFVDIFGKIIKTNNSFEKKLKQDASYFKEINICEMMEEDCSDSILKEMLNLIEIKTYNDNFSISKNIKTKDNTLLKFLIDINLVRDIKGKPSYFVLILQDINEIVKKEYELKKINNELVFKNNNLESFAYAASHDLQEPLRKISAFSSFLKENLEKKEDKQNKEEISYNIENIIKSSKKMSKLINDLLEYSRVGEKNFEKECFDLADVIKELTEDYSLIIEQKNIKFNYFKEMTIYANKMRMKQMFQNFISNSIKFKKETEDLVIDIKYEKFGTKITIIFSDNGIGFPSSDKDKIFLPFKRLHSHLKYEGSGIGLAICKSIIDGHDGKIWVESEVDKGTSFFMEFNCCGCMLYEKCYKNMVLGLE